MITSWSTQANANADKEVELRSSRLPTGTTFSTRCAGKRDSTSSRPEPEHLPQVKVEAGAILGLYHSTIGTACEFDGVPGDTTSYVFAAIGPAGGRSQTPT